jgi:hypothetical protein
LGDGGGNQLWFAPLPWLKRIPPLDELEGRRTEESVRDPVKNFERHFKERA